MAQRAFNLVPKPDNVTATITKRGVTQDIINAILYAYKYNNKQGVREMKKVSESLQDSDIMKTLFNVWAFVKANIKYKADSPGHEKIKNPSYLYHHGVGDCKSFSLMIAGILSNYQDVSFSFRFVSYRPQDDFTHVYIVANIKDRKKEIILDSTHTDFDLEAPYVRKKDYKMTEISFMHGPPGILRHSRPSVSQAFADGPKRAISPAVNIANKSQGEINLLLLDAEYAISEAYYGDPTGSISRSRLILKSALNNLESYQPLGVIDHQFSPLIEKILKAKERHIQQISILVKSAPEIMGIRSGLDWRKYLLEADLNTCLKLSKIPKASWYERNVSNVDYFNYNDEYYEIGDKDYPEFNTCIQAGIQKLWAVNNIFEKDNFKKGCHTLLYEFIESANAASSLNTEGIVKKLLHKTYVGGISAISGLDRSNVSQYIRNGILFTSAQNKLQEITPEFNINTLKENSTNSVNKIGVIDPVTASIVIAIIGAAVKLFSSAMAPKQQSLIDYTKTPIDQSTAASLSDFESSINSAKILNYIAAGAGILGFLYFLSPNKTQSK